MNLQGENLTLYQAVPAGKEAMKQRRITIARCLGVTAILAVNMAVFLNVSFRRFFEGQGLDFIIVALEVGTWCLFHCRGRLRYFWAGFVGFSIAGAFLVISGPLTFLNGLWTRYTDFVDELEITYLPTWLSGALGNDLWFLHEDFANFIPVLVVALLGAIVTTLLIPRSLTPARTPNEEGPTAFIR